jgi:hypothetical protein
MDYWNQRKKVEGRVGLEVLRKPNEKNRGKQKDKATQV